MPKRKRATLLKPTSPPPAVEWRTGTHEAVHIRCPLDGLMARVDLIESGPYDTYQRTETYGGNQVLYWSKPEELTEAQWAMVKEKGQLALAQLQGVTPPPVRVIPRVIPTTVRREPPPPPVAPKVVMPPVPTAIPAFTLPEKASRPGSQKLVVHLRRLEELDIDTPEVDQEMERLEDELQGWLEQVEEALGKEEDKEEPNEDRVDLLQERRDALDEVIAALDDRDIDQAVDALERAFPGPTPKVPRRPVAERMEEEVQAFRLRITGLRTSPDPKELARLEKDMLDFSDRVVDRIELTSGEERQRLQALGERFERAAEGFAKASSALVRGRTQDYLTALDLLAECCPPQPPPAPTAVAPKAPAPTAPPGKRRRRERWG